MHRPKIILPRFLPQILLVQIIAQQVFDRFVIENVFGKRVLHVVNADYAAGCGVPIIAFDAGRDQLNA
jgi:hypothetical protein